MPSPSAASIPLVMFRLSCASTSPFLRFLLALISTVPELPTTASRSTSPRELFRVSFTVLFPCPLHYCTLRPLLGLIDVLTLHRRLHDSDQPYRPLSAQPLVREPSVQVQPSEFRGVLARFEPLQGRSDHLRAELSTHPRPSSSSGFGAPSDYLFTR